MDYADIPEYLIEDLEEAQKYPTYEIEGKVYDKIRFGNEKEDWGKERGWCGDCHAYVGQIHQEGCDVENCPKCHGQAISCGHLDDYLYSDE